MRQLVLFFFRFTRQYRHISRSCGLRFSGIRGVLLKNHQHFDSTSFRLRLRPCVGSQPTHTTSMLKLDSVASELVEYRSTSAARRDNVDSVAHFSNRYDISLQSSTPWAPSESRPQR